jgi:hypothetical protein
VAPRPLHLWLRQDRQAYLAQELGGRRSGESSLVPRRTTFPTRCRRPGGRDEVAEQRAARPRLRHARDLGSADRDRVQHDRGAVGDVVDLREVGLHVRRGAMRGDGGVVGVELVEDEPARVGLVLPDVEAEVAGLGAARRDEGVEERPELVHLAGMGFEDDGDLDRQVVGPGACAGCMDR